MKTPTQVWPNAAVHTHIHDRILNKAGLSLLAGLLVSPSYKTLEELEEKMEKNTKLTEFVALMHNRLLMGFLRYRKPSGAAAKPYDYVGRARLALQAYVDTGNTEYLVDAANYCCLAKELHQHPKKHFASTEVSAAEGLR